MQTRQELIDDFFATHSYAGGEYVDWRTVRTLDKDDNELEEEEEEDPDLLNLSLKPAFPTINLKVLDEDDDAGEILLVEDLTPSEVSYADKEGCVWRVINGARVCIKPRGTDAERAARAYNSYKPVTKEKYTESKAGHDQVLLMTNGTPTNGNAPMDVLVKLAGKQHAIEVKTMVDQALGKITMHPPALLRKLGWGKRNNIVLHTVVVDRRKGSLYSGHEVYYMRGVGSFRVPGRLIRVRDSRHLKDLMSTNAGIGGL